MSQYSSRDEIVRALQNARKGLKEARDSGNTKAVQATLLAQCERLQTILDAWDKHFGELN